MPAEKCALIVDDDENVRLFVQALMESQGWKTMEARNGQEAIDLAEQEIPDLIIMDVMMPVMDGFEAFRRLRESPFTGQIPIIMLTAVNEEKGTCYTAADMETAFGAAAPEGFVEKPVDAAHLLHCLMGVAG